PMVDIGAQLDRERIEVALAVIDSEAVVEVPAFGADRRAMTRSELRTFMGLLNGMLMGEPAASWVVVRTFVTATTSALLASGVDPSHFLERANLVSKFLRRYSLQVNLIVAEDILLGPQGDDVGYLISLFEEGSRQDLGVSLRQHSLLRLMY